VVESGTDARLVDGLAERFDLSIVAREIPGGRAISQEPIHHVPTVIGPPSRIRFASTVWRTLTSSRDPGLVLVQGYGLAAMISNLAARRIARPTLMLVCSPNELYYRCRRRDGDATKPFRRLELLGLMALARLNARIARQYIVLSRHLADVVRGHGTRAPIDIVPVYGVDITVFRPASESKTVLRRRLGLPDDGALIFFSSRIAPEKDAATLLKAIRRLLDDGRNAWLLHRSGGYRSLLDLANRHGVLDRVIATDAVHPQTHLAQDYQASDLLVQASREEGLGFSTLESLACEIPVVATAVGGLRETIREGETGWTYPVGDAAALAGAIAAVLDDPVEAARRATLGRRMVEAEYERRLVFDRLEALLTSI
jgi:glycosyltransferase involved in cell wall biosynthesis